jgi:SAM-dependent methyltransferase
LTVRPRIYLNWKLATNFREDVVNSYQKFSFFPALIIIVLMLTTRQTRQKWEQRYVALSLQDRAEPNPFILTYLDWLPLHGWALDVAAGAGRHSVLLATRGLCVDAVDISWQGLRLARQRAQAAGVADSLHCIVADIEQPWLPRRAYDVVLITYFLYRPLLPLLKDRLRPGGWLMYETFVLSPAENTANSLRRFWLQPAELRTFFSDFKVLFYDEVCHEGHHAGRVTAQLVAQKPA